MTTAAAAPVDRTLAGIGLLIVGICVASLSGALLKLLSDEVNLFVITWGRYAGYLVAIVPFALRRHGSELVRPPQPVAQVLRALLILVATMTFIAAVATLPLATAVALVYVYPFLIALLAPAVLGERASPAVWLGIVAGFTGVVVVMRPDVNGLTAGALWALASGAVYAIHILLTRKVANAAPALVSNTFLALVAFAVATPLAILWWQPVSLYHAALLLLMGAINAVAHGLILLAFARASAPVLAPFSYIEIVWATGWGLLFFGAMPDAVTLAGMGLIIASGVVVAQAGRLGRLLARRRSVSG